MSKELEIFDFDGKPVVNSRVVAEWVDKLHKNLCRDIANYESILTSSGVSSSDFFMPSTYRDAKGEDRTCYLITRKGCEMVANKMIGQKGIIFTALYINRFHEYEKQLLMSRPQDSYMIEDPAARARRWAEEYEERAALAAKVGEQHALLEEQKSQVDFAKHVSDTKTLLTMAEFAKIAQDEDIKIGRNGLYDWMRNNGYIRPGSREPYQRFVDQGLFKVRETTKYNNVFTQTFITGKGQIYFAEKLRKQFKRNGLLAN